MSLEDQLDYIPFFRYYIDNLFTSTQAGNRISSLSNNNATNSIITNNNQLYDSSSTCDTGKLCFSSNFCLTEVSLLPTCLLALLIGCYTSNKIQAKYKFKGSWLYSLTFFLFGIMMTDALIVHCLVPRPDTKNSKWFLISFLVGIIDVGLTSNIGVAFAFCGLSDLKWIDSNSIQTKIGLFSSFTLVFMSWYFALVNQWKNSFIILYAGIVAVGCGIYLLTQIILLSRNVKNQNESDVLGILYFVLGGLSGFIGLGAVFWWSTSICNFLGPYYNPYLGPSFIWFILSDIAVYMIYKYICFTYNWREKSLEDLLRKKKRNKNEIPYSPLPTTTNVNKSKNNKGSNVREEDVEEEEQELKSYGNHNDSYATMQHQSPTTNTFYPISMIHPLVEEDKGDNNCNNKRNNVHKDVKYVI